MGGSGPHGEWLATTPEWWSQITRPIYAFQIWYSDGYCFSGPPSEWSEAPDNGVQIVMLHHANGDRHIIAGKDEYTLPGQPGSKLGELIDEDAFYALQAVALNDAWRP